MIQNDGIAMQLPQARTLAIGMIALLLALIMAQAVQAGMRGVVVKRRVVTGLIILMIASFSIGIVGAENGTLDRDFLTLTGDFTQNNTYKLIFRDIAFAIDITGVNGPLIMDLYRESPSGLTILKSKSNFNVTVTNLSNNLTTEFKVINRNPKYILNSISKSTATQTQATATTLETPKTTYPPKEKTPLDLKQLFIYIGAIFLGFVGIIYAIFILKHDEEPQKPVLEHKETSSESRLNRPDAVSKTEAQKVEAVPQVKPVSRASGIDIKTAFGYKGATIIFKIKMENNTSDPISDIKVYPYVPDVFLLKEKEKSIALIEPKSSQTVTFEIRPTGECGDCNISGRINYYDMASRKRHDIELESKSLSIVCPMLHGKEISEADWHDTVNNLVKTEESTREIEMPAESLFTMTSRIITDMHMYMQKPEITQSQQLFNGVTRFYGEGVKGLKYAAQIEVVGGAKRSKLILKAWAEKEDALTGFYHGILDEIEKRVNVKGYINDSIVQYNVHIGDRIGTQVKDSVVQRSTIGAGARKCPDCGKEVEANEKFCRECGGKL
ncbi:MAG: zinc ribbon domain-containing protein [Euryarchaeota archaeon]|nr:zinc ribbon domain-containing protein [Euryarchaeota archaeon]